MKKYDLIVIGAGNLGTFHAYHALLKGKTVLMIEKDAEPIEATVRNFGQIVPSGQALENWFELGRESLAIYKNIQSKFDITVRQNGTYYLASDDQEMTLLEETRACPDGTICPKLRTVASMGSASFSIINTVFPFNKAW